MTFGMQMEGTSRWQIRWMMLIDLSILYFVGYCGGTGQLIWGWGWVDEPYKTNISPFKDAKGTTTSLVNNVMRNGD